MSVGNELQCTEAGRDGKATNRVEMRCAETERLRTERTRKAVKGEGTDLIGRELICVGTDWI